VLGRDCAWEKVCFEKSVLGRKCVQERKFWDGTSSRGDFNRQEISLKSEFGLGEPNEGHLKIVDLLRIRVNIRDRDECV
jgi:hypothetical protein